MWQRRNKFNVSPKEQRTIDGITFDSKKEMVYYQELLLRKKAKDITGFERQVPFVLQESFIDNAGKKHREIIYIADFILEYPNGKKEVQDIKASKGFTTALYKLKKKMLLYKHRDIIFKEIY